MFPQQPPCPSNPGAPDAPPALSPGACATLACLLEVTAPKPGNVHRGADFEDVSYPEFVLSAVAIGPVFERAGSQRVGHTIRAAIEASRQWVATNTYLGTVLLLAPLARMRPECPPAQEIARVLAELDPQDAADVYAAIRAARPGGLGDVPAMDVAGPPPENLLDAMRAAAERDLVARQYANGFQDVLQFVVPSLQTAVRDRSLLHDAIVETQLRVLATYPDSLIERKCGPPVARHASHLAARTLAAAAQGSEEYLRALGDFDFWLRSDHHRRNPGTTADLIAAGLFLGLRQGWLRPPFTWR